MNPVEAEIERLYTLFVTGAATEEDKDSLIHLYHHLLTKRQPQGVSMSGVNTAGDINISGVTVIGGE